jgi:RimJ/RimL family protein N-acetyltransferase
MNGEYLGEAALVFEKNDLDYSIPGQRIYFSRFIVKQEYRNQGIGTILIDYLCDMAIEMGYSEISVGVDKVNEGALRLYQRKGFDEVLFDGEDESGAYYKLLKKLDSKKIDYNKLANDYDLTRTVNIHIINFFAEELSLDGKTVFDFGCGTGNCAYAMIYRKKYPNVKTVIFYKGCPSFSS